MRCDISGSIVRFEMFAIVYFTRAAVNPSQNLVLQPFEFYSETKSCVESFSMVLSHSVSNLFRSALFRADSFLIVSGQLTETHSFVCSVSAWSTSVCGVKGLLLTEDKTNINAVGTRTLASRFTRTSAGQICRGV